MSTRDRVEIRSSFSRSASIGLVLVATVVLLGAACAPAPAPEATQAPAVTPVLGATPPAAPGTSQQVQDVRVSLGDFTVTLATDTVKAGRVRFVTTNEGAVTHALAIEGEGIDNRTPNLNPGESATLEVDLKPGAYVVYCPVNAHRERGMQAALTVQ